MSGREDAQWQRVQDDAWSEYLYPRSAVGDLSDPNPQSAFMRAARVFRQWALRLIRDTVIAELEALADEMSKVREAMREEDGRTLRSSALGEGVRMVRQRATQLRAGSE